MCVIEWGPRSFLLAGWYLMILVKLQIGRCQYLERRYSGGGSGTGGRFGVANPLPHTYVRTYNTQYIV